jgi:hypothetical protein
VVFFFYKFSYLFMLTIKLIYFDCKKVLHPKKSKVRPESEMCSHSTENLILKHRVNKKMEIHVKHPYAL